MKWNVSMSEEEQKPTQLPVPKGFYVLCALVDAPETFDSGLIKSDATRKVEELSSPVLFVLKLGPEAYLDPQKFPAGPRCAEGDFVLTRPYSGTRVKIHGKEFRLISDDAVEAVVDDPRGISRA
jgi:co-chaperonin GroES (HSP10)